MTEGPKRIPAAFYRSWGGADPVRDWLRGLSPEDRQKLGRDIALVEFGWPIGSRSVDRLARACGKSEATCLAAASAG